MLNEDIRKKNPSSTLQVNKKKKRTVLMAGKFNIFRRREKGKKGIGGKARDWMKLTRTTTFIYEHRALMLIILSKVKNMRD